MSGPRLSQEVRRRLGYYVYLYVNPFTEQVFYVGRGKNDRVLDHLDDASDSRKSQIIAEIRAQGREPRIEILAHGLWSDEEAYRIEAAVIDLVGAQSLANTVRAWRSHYHGRMSLDEIVAIYEREKVNIDEPALLVRLDQSYRYGMSDAELYDATRGAWKLGESREKARLAMAVYDGVVREVYEIEQWFPAGATFSTRNPRGVGVAGRWEFVGRLAEEEFRSRYRLKSVEDHFLTHSQNPIAMINC